LQQTPTRHHSLNHIPTETLCRPVKYSSVVTKALDLETETNTEAPGFTTEAVASKTEAVYLETEAEAQGSGQYAMLR